MHAQRTVDPPPPLDHRESIARGGIEGKCTERSQQLLPSPHGYAQLTCGRETLPASLDAMARLQRHRTALCALHHHTEPRASGREHGAFVPLATPQLWFVVHVRLVPCHSGLSQSGHRGVVGGGAPAGRSGVAPPRTEALSAASIAAAHDHYPDLLACASGFL